MKPQRPTPGEAGGGKAGKKKRKTGEVWFVFSRRGLKIPQNIRWISEKRKPRVCKD